MLTGKELGLAIKRAIDMKISSGAIKTKVDVARHFKIKPPSIHDWIKKGSISKDKLPELWDYFSDVVGPEHWGLKETPGAGSSEKSNDIPLKINNVMDAYLSATDERRAVVDFLLSLPPNTPPWVDSDARAYISALDAKSSHWLNENRHSVKNDKPKKTGT